MTPERYTQIEALLAKAESIFDDYPPISSAGQAIHSELRHLLVKVVVERHRHTVLDLKRAEADRDKKV